MAPDEASPGVTRRRFLGVAGVAMAGVVGQTGTSTPESYGPLGTVTVDGAKEAMVDARGETVHVAASDGFATVDVADPADPQVVAERRDLLADRENGPMRQVYDASLDDDRLLVVGPANPANAPNAALLYDVSDPAAPERLAVHERDHPIHNATLADGVAYLTGNDGRENPLVLLDADSGEELGRWSVVDVEEAWRDVASILRVLHDVTVRDGLAYVAHWDAGTWVVDVSDPSAPRAVVQVRGREPAELSGLSRTEIRREQTERPGNDHYVTVTEDGSLLGIGMEAWDVEATDREGGPGGIELWDVSSPETPERVATLDPPPTSDPSFRGVWTTSHNFEFRADRLYSSWYRGGVRLYDVADPAAPALRRSWRATDRTSFWTAQAAHPGEFFVASSVGSAGALPTQFRTPTAGTVEEPATIYTFPEPDLPTSTSTTTTEDGHGFGALGALGALGVGAWLHRRGE